MAARRLLLVATYVAILLMGPADTHAGAWEQNAKLLASDGVSNDSFGSDVAVSGTTIVVGAENDVVSGVRAGSAYVFVLAGTTWTEQGKLLASDGANQDRFGGAVGISARNEAGDNLVTTSARRRMMETGLPGRTSRVSDPSA